jgi:hypothetical protein
MKDPLEICKLSASVRGRKLPEKWPTREEEYLDILLKTFRYFDKTQQCDKFRLKKNQKDPFSTFINQLDI